MPYGVPFLLHLFSNFSPVITGKYKPECGSQPHADCQVINGKANTCAHSNTNAVKQKSVLAHRR
jgi:hypothetical protein